MGTQDQPEKKMCRAGEAEGPDQRVFNVWNARGKKESDRRRGGDDVPEE